MSRNALTVSVNGCQLKGVGKDGVLGDGADAGNDRRIEALTHASSTLSISFIQR